MYRTLFAIVSACMMALIADASVHAAGEVGIRFDGISASVQPGASIEVRVVIDAPVPVNTVAVDVQYPDGFFQVSGAHFERSIIDIRQQDPDISIPGIVKIVGGSTQAFTGENGLLATIRFKARTDTQGGGVFSVTRAEVYASDGKGTQLPVRVEPVRVVISETGSAGAPVLVDDEAPVIRSLRIESSGAGVAEQLVVFQISDASGIKSTDFRYRTGFIWSEWKSAVNPAAIPRSAWMVEVRAVDYAGNAISAYAYAIPWSGLGAWGIIFLCVGVGAWYVRKKITHRRRTA